MKTQNQVGPCARMKNYAPVLGLLGICLAVSACVGPPAAPTQSAWRVVPVVRAEGTGSALQMSETFYRIGRNYEAQSRADRAEESYRKAILADPGNVEARNALGVLLARLGQLDAAIASLQSAAEIAPARSHVLSNLGYACLLAGRNSEARRHLQEALRLDPDNVKASSNLQLAVQYETGPQGDVLASTSLDSAVQHLSVTAMPAPASGALIAPHAADDRVLAAEVQRGDKPAPDRVATAYRLELSNAMGIRGAARRLSRALQRDGEPPAYLTDQRPFSQQLTQVEYACGHLPEAQRLAARLGASVLQRCALRQKRGVDVRVVLGKDLGRVLAEIMEELGDWSIPEKTAAVKPGWLSETYRQTERTGS